MILDCMGEPVATLTVSPARLTLREGIGSRRGWPRLLPGTRFVRSGNLAYSGQPAPQYEGDRRSLEPSG